MKTWALRFFCLLALTAVACSDSQSPEVLPPEVEIEQKYLFDVYYVNGAWGYVLRGTYVDNQGNVVSYDHSFERWIPEGHRWTSFTLEELDEKYIAPIDTIAHVDAKTLLDMFSLIEEVDLGDLSEGRTTGFDMGTFAHVCYRYNDSTGRYGEILLSEAGDYTRRNQSDAAIELVEWLNAVLAEANEKGK
jgi:hypothetical protein